MKVSLVLSAKDQSDSRKYINLADDNTYSDIVHALFMLVSEDPKLCEFARPK